MKDTCQKKIKRRIRVESVVDLKINEKKPSDHLPHQNMLLTLEKEFQWGNLYKKLLTNIFSGF